MPKEPGADPVGAPRITHQSRALVLWQPVPDMLGDVFAHILGDPLGAALNWHQFCAPKAIQRGRHAPESPFRTQEGGRNGRTPLGGNLGALATRTDDGLFGRTQQFVLGNQTQGQRLSLRGISNRHALLRRWQTRNPLLCLSTHYKRRGTEISKLFSDERKYCPKCESEMVIRTSRIKGN
jgi:hypothetical protein